jgi:mannan endo-1,4-beta-mannosidase
MKTFFLFFLMLCASFQIMAQRHGPVNPNASAGAKKVLNLLYDIKGKYILSGQQNYNSDLNTFSDSAKAITGTLRFGAATLFYGATKTLGRKLLMKLLRNGARVTL